MVMSRSLACEITAVPKMLDICGSYAHVRLFGERRFARRSPSLRFARLEGPNPDKWRAFECSRPWTPS